MAVETGRRSPNGFYSLLAVHAQTVHSLIVKDKFITDNVAGRGRTLAACRERYGNKFRKHLAAVSYSGQSGGGKKYTHV